MNEKMKTLLKELIQGQEKKLLKMGRSIVPTLTSEDVLQPNDYPELENNPLFRYEEGVLEGHKTTEMALLALFQDEKLNL
jgi:hypothetical protein